GLGLNRPKDIQLCIHNSLAGKIPIIIAEDRKDFLSLVRAFTLRNEPEILPDSMGACIVAGFNNWDRIRRHKKNWMAQHPFQNTESSWPEEFKRIIQQKDLYQDTFILMSSGPYSNIAAGKLGIDESEWRRLSQIIRREHECAHYFTRRIFKSMRNNILDELIADYIGIIAALGRFRADWMLHFMGLENFPKYRNGGRLENYRGAPPLSDGAFIILQKLVKTAIDNLKNFSYEYAHEPDMPETKAKVITSLVKMTLEELASPDILKRLKNIL
ncbi:MAG: hypothetical protein GY850_13235, partial [bacterium]|nr:hypothetical protein [bacterium]